MTRAQEKEELQKINDRFTSYIQKVRHLREQSNQLDSSSFLKSAKVLEEEVANLKNLYETELENLRKQLEDATRERNSFQLQCNKYQQVTADIEARLMAETEKNRKLVDDINNVQRRMAQLETELHEAKFAPRQPQEDVQHLRREIDNLTRESETLRRRCEKEQLAWQEADERAHQLTKKLELSEQVHQQQVAELRERLENSTASVLTLEGRVRDLSKTDNSMPELMKQVREAAEEELRKYQSESEEVYNRNIQNLRHQKSSLDALLQQERAKSSEQIQAVDKKMREVQELLVLKMREANVSRDVHIPLKAEIEALKLILQEEERRLANPPVLSYTTMSHTSPTPITSAVSYTAPVLASGVSSYAQQNTAGGMSYVQPTAPSPPPPHATAYLQTASSEPVYIPTTGYDLGGATTQDDLDHVGAGMEGWGGSRYTYETTPSVNKLQIEPSPPTTPRPVGPVMRAKSAPVSKSCNSNVPLVQSSLGQGKDYFDEMFRDLTRETLYTQARPKSSPSDRYPTSVYHDYNTATSSAIGDIKILEVNQEGKFVRLFNEGKQESEFGGYMIQQNVGGHPVAVYRFPPRSKFAANGTITVWSGSNDPILHQPPTDYVWKEQQKWGTGPECTTILCKPNGQAIAWTTAAHRFTKNAFEQDGPVRPSSQDIVQEDTGDMNQNDADSLTEMTVNINEPKPETIYLRREKQQPPTLSPQKHPHGVSPGKEVHPHTGQSRPLTYGNDNSSVNRQSRSQTTRPDPIQGQPYAGAAAQKMGSAPLRKYTPTSKSNIRGNGTVVNKSDEGEEPRASTPPSSFMPPHKRFETGLRQIQSQHNQDFLPPMPRPPLFSAW
ncbi:hypothetical protein FSP39_013445 [Pinctada imbricata]|uniref:LTD domain-containing protein n=1 Tax=Pinctada imbricata TaxID=66713 RepID=A0AA89C7I4_PINIB|nr:hypothetical protein FSP39_013445 [Pinctada imbricata]